MISKPWRLLAILPITTGCMQYLVQPPEPSLAGTPQAVAASANVGVAKLPLGGPSHSAAAKGYLGGKIQQPGYVTAERCQHGDQLGRVLVRRNFWQGLVNWITLGMVAPATVEYTCGNPPLNDDD